jgi:hypothetical protein
MKKGQASIMATQPVAPVTPLLYEVTPAWPVTVIIKVVREAKEVKVATTRD